MTLVKLSSKNQITIPADALLQLAVYPQSQLYVDWEEDRIILQPVKKSVVEEVAGSLNKYIDPAKLGKSWSEILWETKKVTARELVKNG